MNTKKAISLIAVANGALLTQGIAQSDEDEDLFTLSPFEVNASEDEGYRATNTLTGSRLNTELRDTPAPISVMTKEFLDDIGATDLDSMLAYDINSETDFQDGAFSGDSNEDNLAANGASFRSRGLGGSVATDGFRSAGVADSYNLERVGLSRGPNAILFGVGSPGGVVNFRTKRANANSNSSEFSFRIGSYETQRATLDLNRTLIDKKLAVRVLGLWDEKGSHRPYIGSDRKSATITTTYRPFENTSFNASYEVTEESKITSRRWGPIDRVSQFQSLLDSGEIGFDSSNNKYKFYNEDGSFGSNVTNAQGGLANLNTRALIVTNSNNDDILFWEGDGTNGAGVIDNQKYLVTNQSIVNGNNQPSDVPSLFPIGSTTSTGTAESAEIDVNKLTLNFSQKLMDGMFLELAYNKSSRNAGGMIGRNPIIRADLTYELDDGTINPYHVSNGYYAIDQQYIRLLRGTDDETMRLSWSFEKDLGERWGFHRFALMAEEHEDHSTRERSWLAWEDKAIHPKQTPENNNNRVNVRNYFKIEDGNYGAIKAGDLPNMVDGGHEFFSVNRDANIATGFARGSGDIDDIVTTDTKMLVMQNYFFNRRLVTTYGLRKDDLSTQESTMIRDPESSKWRFTTPEDIEEGRAEEQYEYFSTDGDRTSVGAVFHLNKNFSLTANSSEGMQLAKRNRTILPYFVIPDPVLGEGEDYGINFALMDNKLSGSFRYFESSAIGDAGNWNGSSYVKPNNDILQTFQSVFAGVGEDGATPIQDLSAAGLTPLDYVNMEQSYAVSSTADLDELIYTGGVFFLSDRSSSGYELEITGRITKNWDVRVAASKTDYSRTNVLNEGGDWWTERLNLYNELDAYWTSLDSGNQSIIDGPVIDEEGVQDSNRTVADRIAESEEELLIERIEQEQGFGSRPEKLNVWTRYRFNDGSLKGLTIGGGWRYKSKNIAGIDLVNDVLLEGNSSSLFDFMASYRTKGFLGKEDAKVTYQINVTNLFDVDTYLSTKIWTTDDTNEAYTKRGYQENPRQVNFTVKTEF